VTASTDDERSLIEAAQADPKRFLELYDRHVDRVYAYVSRRVRSRAAAEDITSAVFEQALANLLTFEFRGAPFAAWLFRIAANAMTDHWRREGRDSHEPPPDVPDEREHCDLDLLLSLFQLVDRLPDLQRRVIELRFVEGRTIREVAAALDRSEGAVKQLQLRALENLRKGMGHHG
jgi:RNA polymerase sigma-70 factor (ECF subfamily)